MMNTNTLNDRELPDKDCHFINLLKTRQKLKKLGLQANGMEKRILDKYLSKLEDKINAAAEGAHGFPNMCDTCTDAAICLKGEHQEAC